MHIKEGIFVQQTPIVMKNIYLKKKKIVYKKEVKK